MVCSGGNWLCRICYSCGPEANCQQIRVVIVPDKEVYIFEVSKSSFEASVLQNSHQLPVFVEFLGVWSDISIQLESSLAKLAKEFAGQFIFAKVDIDEQQELREKYQVKNVPTLKIFKDGEEQLSLEGMIEEQELRSLLKSQNIFHESDEMRELARQKHMAGETIEAVTLLTQAIQKDPGNTRVAMDMVQIFLDMGELDQAQSLFDRLPEKDRDSDTGRALLGQLTFKQQAAKTEGKETLQARVEANADDHDARFDLAICLVSEHQYKQAMEALFIILEKEPAYKEGAARELIINLANRLAVNDPELAQQYRRRLGSLLS